MPSDWDAALAEDAIAELKHSEGPLLPILHKLQHLFGYIPPQSVQLIADALNLSRAEVHGVISFYHDFRAKPPARLIVKLCRAEACQAAGGRETAQNLLDAHGLNWGEASADGAIAIEPVYCLGLCAAAPAAMIGDELYAGFDAKTLSDAVSAAR